MNGSLAVDLDEFGQLLHPLLGKSMRGIARVAKDAEEAIDPHVDTRRLNEPVVEGGDPDLSGSQKPADRPVGENHRDNLLP